MYRIKRNAGGIGRGASFFVYKGSQRKGCSAHCKFASSSWWRRAMWPRRGRYTLSARLVLFAPTAAQPSGAPNLMLSDESSFVLTTEGSVGSAAKFLNAHWFGPEDWPLISTLSPPKKGAIQSSGLPVSGTPPEMRILAQVW